MPKPDDPMPIRAHDACGREINLEPLPWSIIEPHRRQAFRNHEQSLEQLRARNGLGPCEAVAILEDRKWTRMPEADAIERLAELVAIATTSLDSSIGSSGPSATGG